MCTTLSNVQQCSVAIFIKSRSIGHKALVRTALLDIGQGSTHCAQARPVYLFKRVHRAIVVCCILLYRWFTWRSPIKDMPWPLPSSPPSCVLRRGKVLTFSGNKWDRQKLFDSQTSMAMHWSRFVWFFFFARSHRILICVWKSCSTATSQQAQQQQSACVLVLLQERYYVKGSPVRSRS